MSQRIKNRPDDRAPVSHQIRLVSSSHNFLVNSPSSNPGVFSVLAQHQVQVKDVPMGGHLPTPICLPVTSFMY
jgi:hypothetical protein